MTIQRRDPIVLVPELLDRDARNSHDVAEIGVRLLDDAYVTWLIAESEADQALEAWRERASGSRATWHRAYLAAVDREEAAARDLQRLAEIASSYRWQSEPSSTPPPALVWEHQADTTD